MWKSISAHTVKEAKATKASVFGIAFSTGLDAGVVRARLEAARGESLVREVFPEYVLARELGIMTVSTAREWAEAGIAEVTGLSITEVTARLKGTHGNTEICSAFADVWPEGAGATSPIAGRDTLDAVLSQIGVHELDDFIREAGEPPARLKDDKIDQLARMLLTGETDFEDVISRLQAFDLEVMCDDAGLDSGGLKRDRIRRLADWFERSFGDDVQGARSTRQPDASAFDRSPLGEDEPPASVEAVQSDYECEVGEGIVEEEPEDRPYQAEALEKLQEAFTKYKRVVLSLPTGAGKTFVAAKWLADNLKGKALWLTHREELVKQAERELRGVFRDKPVTRWTSDVKDGSGKVVIATVGCQNIPEGPFEVLVVDEAHHRAAPTYKQWARSYRFDKELGLTATPERADQLKLGYETIVKRSFWDLVEQGYLAAPVHNVVKTDEHYDLRKDRIREDFEEASLRQLDNPKRNAFIVEQFLRGQREYRKTLIFAVNVDHAGNLVETFRRVAPQVRVASILGTTDKGQRRKVVEDFEKGRLDVLVNCKVFVEGFNCKDIETIFLTRPTMSAVLYCQMVGRGTRVIGNKKTFHLVEFEDQLSKYADKLAGFWSLGEKDAERIREATERAKVRLADPPALLPPSQILQWSTDLHSIGGVLAYWDVGSFMQGAMIVYKTEIDWVARTLGADGQIDRAALEAAVMHGHWSNEEKQFLVWSNRSNFRFHLYDFRRVEAGPPPSAPAAVAAIHTTAQEVAPLAQVDAFLGPSDNVDWGGDAAEWRREFLAEQRRVTAVLRVVDDFSGRVTPLKVFDVEDARVRPALANIEKARGAGGDQFFILQDRLYEEHLKGTSITKWRWYCIAKSIVQGRPTFLDLGQQQGGSTSTKGGGSAQAEGPSPLARAAPADIRRFFNEILPATLSKNANAARAIGARFQINVAGPTGGEWNVDVSASGPLCKPGTGHADCTIAITDADLQNLLENPQANGMQLFFAGKLNVSGDQMLAMKLPKLFSFH